MFSYSTWLFILFVLLLGKVTPSLTYKITSYLDGKSKRVPMNFRILFTKMPTNRDSWHSPTDQMDLVHRRVAVSQSSFKNCITWDSEMFKQNW